MYLCVISVSLRFIPRLLLVAVARLTVSCGLQAGGEAFLCPAPGQVWGGLWPESRLAHGEVARSCGVCPRKCSRAKKSDSWAITAGEAALRVFLISLQQKCCRHFLFMELSVTYSLDWWVLKANSCYFCIIISSVHLCFCCTFLVCSPLTDILQCWRFKALMMGKLSENADPLEQLDSMSEKLCVCVCAPLCTILAATSLPFSGQPSDVQ